MKWIGDLNNDLNDMIISYSVLGINLDIATPKGYELEPRVLERMKLGLVEDSEVHRGGKLLHFHDLLEAIKDADVIVTDTW
ncbi:uncharacterized protein MELLADRAFT_33794 [Melampsora larici-populina 98AG31]|uniref:ornithine carbamoyltransferase n=1 Tax=Melampsora larici-populina (strain 98AG31 / pathotype 3-4-7) TaxID=747676 RepID=F4R9W3_MELLP|nr:uncharacterized protein MELLADRAFT_33794 [Melampsora larici-populina 98AG31]EGG10598.1 hypothetical protein MELLADRAFT_33794 [Melampsora larici-populina 98AG31]